MEPTRPMLMPGLALLGLQELRAKWGWFLALGICLVILGTIAIGSSCVTTLVSMVLVGWLLIIGGTMEALSAFACKSWGGFFIDLLTGILYGVVGCLILAHPAETGIALTLLIAVSLIFSGIFRIATAVIIRFPHWGWLLLHGVVNLFLGISIVKQWPLSGLWVIGLFIGIDMLMNGWSLVMLGLTARRIPAVQ
ncbi:MAG: HdeD family acid-resistance protein [Gemmataceae bacterium]|nr:HdeD family acid-resistance protein [Gemmataceae bacterium]